MQLKTVLQNWPNVSDEEYAAVELSNGCWEKCMARIVATLTRRDEWNAARAAGGPGWIHKLAVRRAQRFGAADNAQQWLNYLQMLGRHPLAVNRRNQVQMAIERYWRTKHATKIYR